MIAEHCQHKRRCKQSQVRERTVAEGLDLSSLYPPTIPPRKCPLSLFFFLLKIPKPFISQAVHPRIKCQRWYPYEQNSKDAPLHCICEPAFSKHDVCSSWEAQRTGKRPGYKAVDCRAHNNNGLSSV